LGLFFHIWHLQWGLYSQSQFMVSWWFIGVYPHFQWWPPDFMWELGQL
jgi:hypothetical protein